jgi:2-polyprenyl-3-methyl-5-hydroxy-6-metoxy-1,4-benzoquinol methylase
MSISQRAADFIEKHGEWTAMAIKLDDGTYTKALAVDRRLKRLVQVARDTIKKPLSECRILDLACLEGHYAIKFAMHGAITLGIEGRGVSVAKCNYAKDSLGLKNALFVVDDVRNLSAVKYGKFDIVICSGILYHLPAQDAVSFINSIADVCSGILLIDTFISLFGREKISTTNGLVHDHHYLEHDDNDKFVAEKLWASLDNKTSFWFTETTLINLLVDAGFTSVMDVFIPTMPPPAPALRSFAVREALASGVAPPFVGLTSGLA